MKWLWKWPPQPTSDRACVKYYSLDNASLKMNIDEGTSIFIPIYVIHRDDKYYPNSDRFDLRNCIGLCPNLQNKTEYSVFSIILMICLPGSRFALMRIKAVVYYLLLIQ